MKETFFSLSRTPIQMSSNVCFFARWKEAAMHLIDSMCFQLITLHLDLLQHEPICKSSRDESRGKSKTNSRRKLTKKGNILRWSTAAKFAQRV